MKLFIYRRSLVDVLIRYPTNSIVDMKDITAKLVKEQTSKNTNYTQASTTEKTDTGLELVILIKLLYSISYY